MIGAGRIPDGRADPRRKIIAPEFADLHFVQIFCGSFGKRSGKCLQQQCTVIIVFLTEFCRTFRHSVTGSQDKKSQMTADEIRKGPAASGLLTQERQAFSADFHRIGIDLFCGEDPHCRFQDEWKLCKHFFCIADQTGSGIICVR